MKSTELTKCIVRDNKDLLSKSLKVSVVAKLVDRYDKIMDLEYRLKNVDDKHLNPYVLLPSIFNVSNRSRLRFGDDELEGDDDDNSGSGWRQSDKPSLVMTTGMSMSMDIAHTPRDAPGDNFVESQDMAVSKHMNYVFHASPSPSPTSGGLVMDGSDGSILAHVGNTPGRSGHAMGMGLPIAAFFESSVHDRPMMAMAMPPIVEGVSHAESVDAPSAMKSPSPLHQNSPVDDDLDEFSKLAHAQGLQQKSEPPAPSDDLMPRLRKADDDDDDEMGLFGSVLNNPISPNKKKAAQSPQSPQPKLTIKLGLVPYE